MIHEEAEQQDLVDKVLESAFALVKQGLVDIGDPDSVKRWNLALHGALGACAVRIKHPGFRDEGQEWRIVKLLSKEESCQQSKFKPGRTLVPYVELGLNENPEETRLPLTRVFQGPHVEPSWGERALRVLLNNCGYPEVEIEKSNIPLRAL